MKNYSGSQQTEFKFNINPIGIKYEKFAFD